jgi:hypothetical protein
MNEELPHTELGTIKSASLYTNHVFSDGEEKGRSMGIYVTISIL